MSRLGNLAPRDLERLSAYLDAELSPQESDKVRARLEREPELRQALDELKQVVSAVHGLAEVRVPRDFTLRAANVTRPSTNLFPYLRFATVLATGLFVLTTGLRALSTITFPMAASAPVAELAAEGQQEMFRSAAGTSGPTTEAAAAQEADVIPLTAPATQTPAGTIVSTSAPDVAGIPLSAPTGTVPPPSLAYGADTAATDSEATRDETANNEEVLGATQVQPPAAVDPLAVTQWVSGLGIVLLGLLTVRAARRR